MKKIWKKKRKEDNDELQDRKVNRVIVHKGPKIPVNNGISYQLQLASRISQPSTPIDGLLNGYIGVITLLTTGRGSPC